MRQSQRERVGRVLGARRFGEAEDGGDHPRDLALVGGAVTDERALRDRGRELDHLGPEGGRAGQGDAAPLADPQRGLHVPRGEGALDDDDVRTDARQDLDDPPLDLPQANGHGRAVARADGAGLQEARTLPAGLDGSEADDPRPRVDPQDDRPCGDDRAPDGPNAFGADAVLEGASPAAASTRAGRAGERRPRLDGKEFFPTAPDPTLCSRPEKERRNLTTSDSKATSAVLVAAGRSTRMSGGSSRKPFLEIDGRTVLEIACEAFDRAPNVVEIVVVGHPDDLERIHALAAESASMGKVRRVVAGGTERADSVRAGVAVASPDAALIAIHDVARPLVTSDLVERAIAVAAVRGGAIVALAATDTMKTSSDGQNAESTLDRSVLWSAQTPQVFRRSLFVDLLERALADGYSPTDDSALHETYVGPVPIVPGDPTNLKITRTEDLRVAAAILRERAAREKR